MTHQQMTSPKTSTHPNPYQEGSLVYVLTTPPERTSKLVPRWKGPFRINRVPNSFQIVYKDDGIERTVHINHVKPAKLTAPDLPQAVPPPEPPRPPIGYLPTSLTHVPPALPAPIAATPAAPAPADPPEAPAGPPEAPAGPPEAPAGPPEAPVAPSPAPNLSRRHSPRLHPIQGQANAVCPAPSTRKPASQPQSVLKSRAGNISSSPQAPHNAKMARAHPLTIAYQQALGPQHNPLSFASLHLVDLRTMKGRYLTTLKDLQRALPKSTAKESRFALQGNIASHGQRGFRHSMQAAIWFLLPSNGEFLLDPQSLQYFLAYQGHRVILRGVILRESR